jgi:1,4-alpha-glucan branching enzyme
MSVVACSLNESPLHDYAIGFPAAGRWREMFNSDIYDHEAAAPITSNGNVDADGPPLHARPARVRHIVDSGERAAGIRAG